MDVLVFEVGGVRYGLPAPQVREVLRAVTIVPLPRAPSIVEGIIDLRGDVVPVLDLRARFRLTPKALSHTDHLIVAWAGTRPVAVRADRAQGLVRVETASIADPRDVARDTQYIAGIARLPDGLVLIQNLREFLDAAETAALDDAMTAPSGGRST